MAPDFVMTPWESRGEIDYDRLISMFGTRRLDDVRDRLVKMAGQNHHMIRRAVFFSHRDLDMILDSHRNGKGFFLYTGRGPSGNTHIGHLVPWVFAKWLQDRFGATMYFQLTDDEKFYHPKGKLSLEDTKRMAFENAKDFAALGFDPAKTHILVDTQHIRTLYPLAARVAKRITYSSTKATFGFGDSTNIGMIFYTAMQSAPCFLEEKPVLIPMGIDQDPHFRLTRDVAPLLKRPKPALLHNVMIPGLRGPGGKMSASDPNSAIYTTDTPSQIKKKINKYAYSGGQDDIEAHRRLGGDIHTDVSYQYLRIFFEPDEGQLRRIRDQYTSGAMLSGELKQILIEKITSYMEAHQSRRESVDLGEYMYDEHENTVRR